MSKQTHLKADDRKTQILDAAVRLSEQEGYMRVGRDDIADLAGCASSLVVHYFGTMIHLRRAIMSAAVHRENLTILAQGLSLGDSKARAAPLSLRARAAAFIVSGE